MVSNESVSLGIIVLEIKRSKTVMNKCHPLIESNLSMVTQVQSLGVGDCPASNQGAKLPPAACSQAGGQGDLY